MNFLTVTLVGLLLTLSGCTHLQSVSTSTIPKDRSNTVKAESYRFIFLGFNFNNDYVNSMVEDLADQCPKGKVEGVLTKHESIVYFPLFAHAVQVTAEGFCVGKPSKKRKKS